MRQKLNRVTELFPEIREQIDASARACDWPEFETQISRHLTATSLPPHVVLPIASAGAVGGEPRCALSVAVACAYLIVSMRWFDDTQDNDRPETLCQEIGLGRAINMAATALTVAWRALAEDSHLPFQALRIFGEHSVSLAHGQDMDLRGGLPRTLEHYWRVMRGKTGAALALGCEVGALAARPDKTNDAKICGCIGEHLGILLQILDDLDGVFHPDGIGDLRAGRITLPLLYGLAVDHGAREELAQIVSAGLLPARADRVMAILESIDTREFLAWCAFEERKQALALLRQLPAVEDEMAKEARRAIAAFADSLMIGWEELVAPGNRHRRWHSAQPSFLRYGCSPK